MLFTPTPHEQELIKHAVFCALAQANGLGDALPAQLLFNRDDHRWPLWLALCQAVIVERRFCTADEHALLCRQLMSSALRFGPEDPNHRVFPDSQVPVTPGHMARLAAHQAGLAGVHGCAPDSLTEDLVCRIFAGSSECDRAPDLDLTQLLVGGRPGAHDSGLAARLELSLIAPETLQRPGDFGALVRAPGAALLHVNTAFADGLDQVQRLMRRVLADGSPGIAWNLRPLPEKGHTYADPLPAVTGPSATAALAYGALYLLRGHLRDEHKNLREWLHDSDPRQITITAALDGPGPDPSEPFAWPNLVRIDGVDDKVGAVPRLPDGRGVSNVYVATGQHRHGHARRDTQLPNLQELVKQIGRDTGSGLDDDARALHELLVRNDEPVADMLLLTRVAESPTRPASLKAFLVWRYARRAAGALRAFGDPVRLDQHFVRLVLRPEPNADDDRQASQSPQPERPPVVELRHLLHDPEFHDMPAWCIDAPPFSGKTTLLAAWEMGAARRALQRYQREGAWGEVCVYLPMRAFAPPSFEDPAKTQAHVVETFKRFIDEQAAGLPPIDTVLSGQAAAPGLKLRLLVDALNETRCADLDHRREAMTVLCTWMGRQRHLLLPPVFTVRTLENGLNLVSDADEGWRARSAQLLPWVRSEWRDYITLRQLQPDAEKRLLAALRADLPDTTTNSPFEDFCATPGILAAQCTLLDRWPDLTPPDGRGPLFLALLWHCLEARGRRIPASLLPEYMRGRSAIEAARARKWRLPEDPGLMLRQLAKQANVMQDAAGQAQLEVPVSRAPPDLQGTAAQPWLTAVRELGLAEVRHNGMFAFVHQQWLEFFAAMGLGAQEWLPDLSVPPLLLPDEASLVEYLAKKGSSLELPAVTPHHERVRFAVSMVTNPLDWIVRLLALNWALAAQVAIDHRDNLEPAQGDGTGLWTSPHPVLQHLRRVLLLHSVDAGATARGRLAAGGVNAALEQPVAGLPEALQAHWREEFAQAFQGKGRDVRERLQAGLLLGELGDNLRYERVSVQASRQDLRTGLRLRRAHWVRLGNPGKRCWYRIGSDADDELAYTNVKPAFEVELDYFEMAAYTVTVGEWRAFVKGGGYRDPQAPWWVEAGVVAQAWLRRRLAERKGRPVVPWGWDNAGFSNSLQPVVGITAHEALAYARWAAPLYGGWPDGLHLQVPTEAMWEAGARGPLASRHAGTAQRRWPHEDAGQAPDALAFNHANTRWGRTTPVGVFSEGLTALGVSDAAGNVWEWCSNAVDADAVRSYEGDARQRAAQVAARGDDDQKRRRLRGGGYKDASADCRVAFRERWLPNFVVNDNGVRLVRCVQPHSEP